MQENILFEITLFDPERTLINKLEKLGIAYRKVPVTQKFLVAMDETIFVIHNNNSASLIVKLVHIFQEWLNENQSRKLQVLLVDGSTVYIEANDSEGVINILQNSLKISAFDPEYNNQIINR